MTTETSKSRARKELCKLVTTIRSYLADNNIAGLSMPSHLAKQIHRFVDIICPGKHIMKELSGADMKRRRYTSDFREMMKKTYHIDISDPSQVFEKRNNIISEHTQLVRMVVSQLLPMFPNYLDYDPVDVLGKEYFGLLERCEKYRITIESKGEGLTQREIDEIDRRERAVGPFYIPDDKTIKEVDRIYFKRIDKSMCRKRGSNDMQSLRMYWDTFIEELLTIFNYIKVDDILFETLKSIIGIGIESYWFETYISSNDKHSPVFNITALYDKLVQESLIEPERSECFCDVFRNHISLGLPRPIVWFGTTSRQHDANTGNATMLYYLISALRNWEKYKRVLQNPESVEVKEILTKKDREGISKFFTGPSEPIRADSLKFSTKNAFVGEYIYDLITRFKAGS